MQYNVIIINDYAHINGGASKVAIKTAIALKKRGYNIVFFSAVPPIDDELKDCSIRTIITEQYDILNNPNRLHAGIQGLWNKKAEKIFSNLLDNFNPKKTVLHFHSWTKALSPSVFFSAIKKKFNMVITVHDYFLFCPNGGFFDYRKFEICNDLPMTIKCLRRNCDSRAFHHKIWRLMRQLIQNNVLKSVKSKFNLIVPSNFTKSLIKKYLSDDSCIHVIENPISVERNLPIKVKKNDIFVYVGRLSKEKGVLLFAKAASKLGINIIFIGDGYLKNEILKIYSKALITGWVSENRLKELIKSARVLVYPTLWYETQGLAVLEAKAMGIPAIISDCCAAKDYIVHMVDGLLFRSGNVNDLIEKLTMCMDDSLVDKMSERAYENYWKHPYTVERYIDLLEQFYQLIIEKQ